MKTILSLSSLFAFAAIPITLALETAGVSLQPNFGLGSAFGLFVVSFMTLTAFSDYARAAEPRLVDAIAGSKAPHPLAA
jgi:hypothetical protein